MADPPATIVETNVSPEDEAEHCIAKQDRFETVFEKTPVAMALVDAKARILCVNRAGKDAFNLSVDQTRDGRCGQLLRCINSRYGQGCGTNRPCQDCVVRNSIRTTFNDCADVKRKEGAFLVERNGRYEKAHLLISTIRLSDDHVLLTLEDVTDHRLAQESVIEAIRKLGLLSSITRHDMLNTLTALTLSLGLLEEKIGEDVLEQTGFRSIQSLVDRLVGQVEFTRLYNEMGSKAARWHDLHEVIASSIGCGFNYRLEVDSAVKGMEVFADTMLSRVFNNILENAQRHGGSVTRLDIGIAFEDGSAIIRFADDGVGVPENAKQRIFDKGYGNNNGLGLFLAREILSLTELSISEEGVHGEGATFAIKVPSHRFRVNN